MQEYKDLQSLQDNPPPRDGLISFAGSEPKPLIHVAQTRRHDQTGNVLVRDLGVFTKLKYARIFAHCIETCRSPSKYEEPHP